MRDLGMLDPGYRVIAGSVGPSHAFVHVTGLDCVRAQRVRHDLYGPNDLDPRRPPRRRRHRPAEHIERMPAAIDIVACASEVPQWNPHGRADAGIYGRETGEGLRGLSIEADAAFTA